MPSTEHVEKHFTASAAVRDIVIGMADGLTVPFALAAGLTGAVESTGIVVKGCLAEIAAGSIAMGLGGYLAAKTDAEHYKSELDREYRETVELPEIETEEVAKVFRDYGLSQAQMAEQLGISPSYLNLIEHNQRPVTLTLLLKLGQNFEDNPIGIELGKILRDLTLPEGVVQGFINR